jgi:hypothetical protein
LPDSLPSASWCPPHSELGENFPRKTWIIVLAKRRTDLIFTYLHQFEDTRMCNRWQFCRP